MELFRYNWQVREEWFHWCKQLSKEEWSEERVGGVGSFQRTLLHIIDVEYSWIRAIQGKADKEYSTKDYETLEKIKELSNDLHTEVKEFVESWSDKWEEEEVYASWLKDSSKKGEVLRHIIAHEIHHIGQLSIWSRELGLKPVSSNFIGRVGLNSV